MGNRKLLAIALAMALAVGLTTVGAAGAGVADRAASPEAKEACQKLKDKIKGKKGKAKAKAKAKYKKCLEEYDEANTGGGTTDPGGGTGGGTTDPGGGTTDPGGGTGGGAPQCTSLETCPQLTRNDAAGQQAMGAETILERYTFGSSGQTAEYYRLFFYGGGAFKGVAVDWNSVGGETCRSRATGVWSFKAGYTYALNGGGVLVEVNLTAGGQSGTEVLDFRNGAGSSVYVGPQALHFEENPQANDQC